nr:hypothetical protein [Tanacetum cinerariifolium]
MSSFNQQECLGCGQLCDGLYCYPCPLSGGFCLFRNSKAENSFTYDPNAYSFNDTSSNFNHLPQPQYETCLCKLCGNDSHYGYDCPPQFPLVYEQEPSYNQNYNDNYYPHNSPSFLCCDNYEGSHETFQCQPMDQNINSTGFDQIQPPVIHHPSQEMSEEILQAKENIMKSSQTFLKKFNRIYFGEMPNVLSRALEKFFEIQHAQPEDTNELLQKLLEDLQIISEELAEYINSPSWNHPTFYNNDEEHSIQYKEYLENSSNAITTVLPTKEPEYSLSMGLMEKLLTINLFSRPLENFHANTIIETLITSHIPIKDSDSLREEIDIFTGTDDFMPPGIESDDYDSEGDIHFLEESLSNDSISLPKNESSNFDHHDDPSFPRPLPEPPDVEIFF